MSECWRFYAVPTARVIFMVKTCLDVFSLRSPRGPHIRVSSVSVVRYECCFVIFKVRLLRFKANLVN